MAAYPQFAEAWSSLAVIHEEAKEMADARRCFSQALAADPKLVTPYLHLARFSLAEKNWQDVAATTSRLIKLDPYDFPEAYFYNAVADYNLHKYDAAHASALEAQKLDTAHKFPKVEHLLGVILYQKKATVSRPRKSGGRRNQSQSRSTARVTPPASPLACPSSNNM